MCLYLILSGHNLSLPTWTKVACLIVVPFCVGYVMPASLVGRLDFNKSIGNAIDRLCFLPF